MWEHLPGCLQGEGSDLMSDTSTETSMQPNSLVLYKAFEHFNGAGSHPLGCLCRSSQTARRILLKLNRCKHPFDADCVACAAVALIRRG